MTKYKEKGGLMMFENRLYRLNQIADKMGVGTDTARKILRDMGVGKVANSSLYSGVVINNAMAVKPADKPDYNQMATQQKKVVERGRADGKSSAEIKMESQAGIVCCDQPLKYI